MAKSRQAWLSAPNVTWTWVTLSALVWGGLGTALYRSAVGDYLQAKLAIPVDFNVRDVLGKGAPVSERLKVFGIDDQTLAKKGEWVLPMSTYAKVLRTLAERRPQAIVIDAMFSTTGGDTAEEAQALKDIAALRSTVPIVLGAFAIPAEIRHRNELNLQSPDFSIAAMAGRPPGTVLTDEELPLTFSFRDQEAKWHVYGPSAEMQRAVAHVGHFLYKSDGRIFPIARVDDDQALLHFSLFAAKERKIENGRLLVDGTPVPIGPDGAAPVNFITKSEWVKKVHRTILKLLDAAEAGEPYDRVSPGDVVLILPHMYTGNTDFKATPYGQMPAGYVIASAINSVLTGEFLKPVFGGELLTVAAAVVGALLAMRLGALAFWATLGFGTLLGFAAAQAFFAYQGIVVPWLFPSLSFVGASVSVFAEKTRASERKVAALRVALEGAVAPDELKSILKHPERVALEARERVVTLMFIDVVGFSLLAENMLPRMAFENLKKMLTMIGETIHQFGGVIDKTLGDGLLCYFGYRFDSDTSAPDHAEKALRCAIKIQRDNLARNLEASAQGEPVYPLRIGVNTSSCYLGDLGTSSRIDFTVVGNGVNFAKRLEGACEMHSVLMGATTHDLVKGIGLPLTAVTRRFIRIKHHSELVEAHEYDPFFSEPDLRLAAVEGFRKCANIERVDQRWPVHDPSKIRLQCDFGTGQLVNFSHTGLSIRLKQLLAKGTRLNISLDSAGGALKALLAKEGISILQGEVRWGYAEGDEFVHGVMLNNVTETQSDAIVQYLCEFAFARESLKDGSPGDAKAS
jgi:class 3 adenylate cyclase